MGVDKLELLVTDWEGITLMARVVLDYNPNGTYSEELVERIKKMPFLEYKVYDTTGNEVGQSEITARGPGHTYFVKAIVKDGYSDYIELKYEDGVKKKFDFTTDYAPTTPLTEVDRITQTHYEEEYTGEPITFVLDFLADKPYLMIVEGESALTQTEVGKYYVTVCFRDESPYCWKSSNNQRDRSAVEIELEITRKTLEIEVEVELGGYTGIEIDIAVILKEKYGDYLEIVYGSETKINGAGWHEIKVVVSSKYVGNLEIEGAEIAADGTITLKWYVEKAELSGEWNAVGKLDIESETYVGGLEGVIEYEYIHIATGEKVSANALKKGEKYKVTATIVDKDNFNWTAEFEAAKKYIYEFELQVDIVILSKPEFVVTEKEYTGGELTFELKDAEKYEGQIEIVSGSLTEVNAGTYRVTIKLINEYAIWDTDSRDEVTIEFTIKAIQLHGDWDRSAGTVDTHGYNEYIEYIYKDIDGNEVTRAEMKTGETYTVTVVLKASANGNYELSKDQDWTITFVLDAEIKTVAEPKLSVTIKVYTGGTLDFTPSNWGEIVEYVEIEGDSFSQTNAKTYTVILRLKAGIAVKWYDGSTGEKTITFTIESMKLEGKWNESNDGRVTFTNEYKGNYDEVVEYVYIHKSTQTTVKYSELVAGETYIATVRIRESAKVNFEFAEGFQDTYEFTYEAGKSGIAWWLILLLVLAAILVIVIIIIIIIVIKRRAQTEYEYEDVYEDGYDPNAPDDSESMDPDYDPDGEDEPDIDADGGYETDTDADYGELGESEAEPLPDATDDMDLGTDPDGYNY